METTLKPTQLLPELKLPTLFIGIHLFLILHVLRQIIAVYDETIVIDVDILYRFDVQDLPIVFLRLCPILLQLAQVVLELELVVEFDLPILAAASGIALNLRVVVRCVHVLVLVTLPMTLDPHVSGNSTRIHKA